MTRPTGTVQTEGDRRARRKVRWAGIGFVLCLAATIVFGLTAPPPPGPTTEGGGLEFLVIVLLFPLVGFLILARQPRNHVGSILVAIGFAWVEPFSNLGAFLLGHGVPGGAIVSVLSAGFWAPPIVLTGTVLLLRFPDGELLSPSWRKVERLAIATMVAIVASIALFPGDLSDQGYPDVTNPLAVGVIGSAAKAILPIALVCLPASIILSAASLVQRFRRSRGDERLQMKWLTTAAGIVAATYFIAIVISIPNIWGAEQASWVDVVDAISFLAWALIPIAIGFAVLRYRLYDIDVVIRKTLVFALLAAFIGIVYGTIVAGIGALVGSRSSSELAFIAAVVVAIAFQPARDRTRRFADRLVYGKRATPYEVLAKFSGRVGETYSTDDVLPRMAEILATGTGASAAHVWLRVGVDLRPVASFPADAPPPQRPDLFEVRHRDETLGALSVEMPPSDPMDSAKRELIEGLAGQAGLVLRNFRLVEELRASRQRLIIAQDEERQRLERNLHDGAQQQLVALSVKLRLAGQIAGPDDARLKETLASLQTDATDALENLRELARGIYPPLLADRGLAAALEAQARRAAIPIMVESDGVDRYPREIESAVYFCSLEALNNVAKYADASSATVRLAVSNGTLTFEVRDDGDGFDSGTTSYGTGLQGMADRLDAVGGTLDVESAPGKGTTVIGRVPTSTL